MLSFSMSEEQKIMKDTVAKLVKDIVIDRASEMDESGKIPMAQIQAVWELGATLSMVPEAYGGYGMDYSPVMNTIVLEELAFGDMALTIASSLPSMVIFPLNEMGTKEQKDKYLPLFCTDSYPSITLAINEPHFGFDIYDMKTVAQKKNGAFVLNGQKCFVPLASQASHMIIAASFEGESSLFIVEKDNPGIAVGEREKNLGLYALETYEITLENCEIPCEDRLGGETGSGFDKFVQKSRIAMSAMGTGLSRASFEFARDYARERVQFGEPIAHRQSIAFMIAEMAYEVDAMRLLTWQAASKLEAGKDARRESYLAKLYAGEMTMKITDYGVQILGGHGYIRDYPVERFYRNGRGIGILEGMTTV